MLTVAIGLNANNRPRYLLDVLASWDRATRFAGPELELVAATVRQEPGPEAEQCAEWARMYEWDLVTNEQRLGVRLNPWTSMQEDVFGDDLDLMVLAEDDSLVAADSFMVLAAMLDHARSSDGFNPDRTLYCLNHRWAIPRMDVPDPASVITRSVDQPTFAPSVWACTPLLWREVLGPRWNDPYAVEMGWDWNLGGRLIGEFDLAVMVPSLSRSTHIGDEGGEHVATAADAQAAKAPTFDPHSAVREFRYEERGPL